MTKAQLIDYILENITDPLERQNTAEVVRDVLGKIIDDCFNVKNNANASDPPDITVDYWGLGYRDTSQWLTADSVWIYRGGSEGGFVLYFGTGN